jgi:hypothetical protein
MDVGNRNIYIYVTMRANFCEVASNIQWSKNINKINSTYPVNIVTFVANFTKILTRTRPHSHNDNIATAQNIFLRPLV